MNKNIVLISLISLSVFTTYNESKQLNQYVPNKSNYQLLTVQSSNKAVKNINEKSNTNVSKVTYQLTKQIYKKQNVTIAYPQIIKLSDTNKQKKINEIIKKDALELLSHYKSPYNEFSVQINYNIKSNTANVLSIQYSGLENFKNTPHPTNLFFTTNININKAKKIKLSDVVTINETLIKKFRNAKYVSSSEVSSELKKAISLELGRLNNAQLIKMFKNAETSNSRCFSYLTKDSLGISINVPHPVGDHAEFEIKFNDIKSNVNKEAWNNLIK